MVSVIQINDKDIDLCLKSAKKVFDIWKNIYTCERSIIIKKISDLIRMKKENLSK